MTLSKVYLTDVNLFIDPYHRLATLKSVVLTQTKIMKISPRIIYLLPRILCIIAILFISLFALDAFNPELTVWQQIRDFLMHLIPSFILTLFLLIAWKWELVGGIIFLAIGLFFTPIIFMHNFQMNNSVWMSLGVIAAITFPFMLVGILFILGYRNKSKQKPLGN